MRIVFAGTPEFARAALARLHTEGFEIALVLTQPDRPAGRGMKLQASPVKQFALAHGLPVAQPRSLRLDGKFPEDAGTAREVLAAAHAQAMVVAAYGLILPAWVLQSMDGPGCHGCLNIHASLLPRWRGAAPIHRAIEAGDAETGITIMQMDEGLDTGDMLLSACVPVGDDSTAVLHDRLAALGADLIVQALHQADAGALRPVVQPAEGVTYAHKIEKAEAAVDWTQDAMAIVRRIRAFDPFPGASTAAQGETLKLWAAVAEPGWPPQVPGTVLEVAPHGIAVAAGSGAVRLTELQRPGGKRLPAAEFVRGCPLAPGQVLG